ncbi:NAD(P)-binding protein [Rhizodiscina lignyota]|uniref:NAD(P)-binding protein n=1 Tax=Rhizodiscina lignyota TaxID=1504668 RepID=A0A9P4M967_9PEZI|nr:NAD(P)-binding protein [Rhizodiscina lignyota]
MSPIVNVSVLGASGNLGECIVPALLKSGFVVTVIIRPGSRGYTPPKNDSTDSKAVTIKEAAYDDVSGLTAALQGQDALVEAFNPAASVHQRTIVRAALAAGIEHLITNEFGMDTFNPNVAEAPIGKPKALAQRALEEELQAAAANDKPVSLTWTGIITGVWYDWTIRTGLFWMNPTTRTITRYGSGNQRTSLSRLALTGEAVVAVLRNPEHFRNRPAYIASHTVSTNELIALVNEISESPEKSWNVVDIPDMEAFMTEGMRLWDEDTKNGVEDRLNSQAWVTIVIATLFDEKNRFGTDLEEKLEPGWDEGREKLKDHLKQLIIEADS